MKKKLEDRVEGNLWLLWKSDEDGRELEMQWKTPETAADPWTCLALGR